MESRVGYCIVKARGVQREHSVGAHVRCAVHDSHCVIVES